MVIDRGVKVFYDCVNFYEFMFAPKTLHYIGASRDFFTCASLQLFGYFRHETLEMYAVVKIILHDIKPPMLVLGARLNMSTKIQYFLRLRGF